MQGLNDIIKRFDMMHRNLVEPPTNLGIKLNDKEEEELKDLKQYRALVGCLQYLSNTRPDITYSVNQIAQFMKCPRTSYMVAAERVLRCIKGT